MPSRGNAFSHGLALLAMRLTGWHFEGALPDRAKFVLIVAPHTSNWDFLVGVMAMFALGIRGTFLGKHTLFRWPLGIVMRWLGGVPVDRSAANDVVRQTVAYFETRDQMLLALSPEGTRKKLPAWRTGFYHVARGAGVPIVPVAFDFPNRRITIFPEFHTTGDQAADFAALGANFDARMAMRPANY
ncbi:MAG: lysophospholipid acyltransferase family protein [Gemmatimonadetes bacterium]|nr:lysophospholipid acyltransferase family protein [Gemmatimonadota bacterium]